MAGLSSPAGPLLLPSIQEEPTEDIASEEKKAASPDQWEPSVAIGSPLTVEGESLSRVELADRKIIQRRAWVEYYKGVDHFAKLLQEAIDERAQLDERNEENTRPL